MKRYIAAGVLTLSGLISVPLTASAQDNSWLMDLQNQQCSEESRQTIANSVRQQIEDSIARATAAIQPPAALGDLSCLNDLMTAPLDSFSGIGGILGSLQGGLTGAISGAGSNVSRQVCQFAAEKWGEVTGPLTGRMSEISSAGVGSNLWNNFNLSGNGSSPSNTPSRGVNTLPGETFTPINPNTEDDTTPTTPNAGGEDPIPSIDGCTPVLEALQLCTTPPTRPIGGSDR